ncbi:HugZ family protein [Thiomicrospira sp. WB1]|uniref:HugZ family pyridoxamine 5'-phosphate oxidase n=1 Tax=Thiomicrospira sp. WB1 TaxID=1685380 RepID=UPI000747FEAA|nr:pyridoxamine 5'-phosphate oxidase family protein [Thiomicrospira sp. WB1]KUJ71065.1 hypothetical protein AVO41_09345 [Thiomicrospira sp. WB1]
MNQSKPLQSIAKEFHAFMDGFESVILATQNKKMEPEPSYAPVLRQGRHFYVFVSELSAHTFNLMESEPAGMLFIEPEGEANHLFARKRATLKASSRHVPRTDDDWEKILDRMETKFGDIITMLRKLEDFHLFELTPRSAGYVRGFAQAYRIEGEHLDEVTHLREGGHGQSRMKAS